MQHHVNRLISFQDFAFFERLARKIHSQFLFLFFFRGFVHFHAYNIKERSMIINTAPLSKQYYYNTFPILLIHGVILFDVRFFFDFVFPSVFEFAHAIGFYRLVAACFGPKDSFVSLSEIVVYIGLTFRHDGI
jgi:hypothetical protein